MEHCYVPWSLGQEGEEEHKLKCPCAIATNSSGHFIVGDINGVVKVFDPLGQFMQHFSVPNDDVETNLCIHDVATDNKDSIYVLVRYQKKKKNNKKNKKTGSDERFFVYKFSNTADLHLKFPVGGEVWKRELRVTNSHVLVLSSRAAAYDTDGQFVRWLGGIEELANGTFKDATDIASANDGRVMVADGSHSCVRIFSEDGVYLNRFELRRYYYHPFIAFHRWSENFVIAGQEEPLEYPLLHLTIFTKDGDVCAQR